MELDVLMLLDNPFTNDRRVAREATAIAEAGFRVGVACMASAGLPQSEKIKGVEVFRILSEDLKDIKKPGLPKKTAKEIIKDFSFRVIHCHDQFMLHLGTKIKKLANEKPVLIYDSHELFHAWPLNVDSGGFVIRFKSTWVRKFLIFQEYSNRKKIDYLITVNQSLADDLK